MQRTINISRGRDELPINLITIPSTNFIDMDSILYSINRQVKFPKFKSQFKRHMLKSNANEMKGSDRLPVWTG